MLVTYGLLYLAYALITHGLGVANAGLFLAFFSATQLLAIPASALGTMVTKISAHAAALGELIGGPG